MPDHLWTTGPPGTARELPRRADVVVVGAGLAGLACARRPAAEGVAGDSAITPRAGIGAGRAR